MRKPQEFHCSPEENPGGNPEIVTLFGVKVKRALPAWQGIAKSCACRGQAQLLGIPRQKAVPAPSRHSFSRASGQLSARLCRKVLEYCKKAVPAVGRHSFLAGNAPKARNRSVGTKRAGGPFSPPAREVVPTRAKWSQLAQFRLSCSWWENSRKTHCCRIPLSQFIQRFRGDFLGRAKRAPGGDFQR